ncbi:DUF4350 domain-containing protein [Pseudoalteromonas luteoviolacea]|uniref:DUF4350 domain-containing protein n=1 Tax=Pseudoalteromonas luteoviolacea TaxID=43657 RepID=UPI00115210AC|nr:DUF4350 domain-containing protein [Pseudoalteromonas luteoviolacea]TQF70041.1 DUF4350 domain-containing protein [Pseudoalteromonas luteoviolacea]
MMGFKSSFAGAILIFLISCSDVAQQAEPNFAPKNSQKTFSDKNSPIVLIDEAHNNFLTLSGRFRPFAQVLESDGYTVLPNRSRFSADRLLSADILIIANALDKNRKNWSPPFSSALTEEEVESVKNWVLAGGSLFLVADHAPFPHIIENLASEFGFKFINGHVGDAMFYAKDSTLTEHSITTRVRRLNLNVHLPQALINMHPVKSGRIDQVRTFGGSAFKAPNHATSLLNLGEEAIAIVPDIPFQIDEHTPRISMSGWSQGAVVEVGKGRVAVFAEGMMFSSQLDANTGKTLGLASKGAEQNEAFLLNVMGWLAGVI